MKAGYEVIMTDSGPRFAVLLGALADGAKRIPIAVIGQFKKGAQAFAITRQTLADLVANFRRRTIDTVIDYEHASEFPEDRYISPVIDYGARDKHSGQAQGATLVAAALTNRPFLEGLPALAMSANLRDRGPFQTMVLAEIETNIAAKCAANKKLNYATAWSQLAMEQPGLIASYNAAVRMADQHKPGRFGPRQ